MTLWRRAGQRPSGDPASPPPAPAEPPDPAASLPLLPSYPPPGYLGQLAEDFQRQLGRRRGQREPAGITWYHTTELPDGRVLPGAWDLRGHEGDYLGGVEVAGKRVLELGPATGYLTYYMERQGAEVVSFEAGFDVSIDLLPVNGRESTQEKLEVMTTTVDQNHEAWWYLHHAFGSAAKFVQGDIYALPADLGLFEVTVVGAILLHLREPWGALSEAARRTTEYLVVTEPLQDDLAPPESNIMRFSPSAEHHLSNWWSIYPGAVVSMLERLGFAETTVREHRQHHHLAHQLEADPIEQRMYTVVGRRTGPPRPEPVSGQR